MAEPQIFALQLSQMIEKAKTAPEKVVRRAVLDIAERVIVRSPVDTGRFKANWNIAFGKIDTLTTTSTDAGGSKTLALIKVQLNGWSEKSGDIFLTNSLPYAIPLEEGHSKAQAPMGMVKITVTEFQTFIQAAAAEVSSEK